MAQLFFIEQHDDESWKELTASFMQFCIEQRGVTDGGCHEGDGNPTEIDGATFASVTFPDHCSHLTTYLAEWADAAGRTILPQNHEAEQDDAGKPDPAAS